MQGVLYSTNILFVCNVVQTQNLDGLSCLFEHVLGGVKGELRHGEWPFKHIFPGCWQTLLYSSSAWRGRQIFLLLSKIPFAGFDCKIFHCLKMPHSDSKLVLNFVDSVPIAIKKYLPEKDENTQKFYYSMLTSKIAQWDSRILAFFNQLFPILLKVESEGVFCLHLLAFLLLYLPTIVLGLMNCVPFFLDWHIFKVLIQYPGVLKIAGVFLFNPEILQIQAHM